MKLQKVEGTPVYITCVRCGKRVIAGEGHDTVADLEGKAFVDYYCAECAKRLPVLPVIKAQY